MRIKIDADLALGFSKAELTELGKLRKTDRSTQYQVVPISFTRQTRKNWVDRAVLVGECEVLDLPVLEQH